MHTNIFISTVCGWSSLSLFAIMPFASPLMDIISPLENGESHRIWPLHADYIFFDKENYFYLLAFHTAFAAFLWGCLFASHDTAYILAIYQACGMLSVVR